MTIIGPFRSKQKIRISFLSHAETEKWASTFSFFLSSEFNAQLNMDVGTIPSLAECPSIGGTAKILISKISIGGNNSGYVNSDPSRFLDFIVQIPLEELMVLPTERQKPTGIGRLTMTYATRRLEL
jgi:hypothetical protein